MNFPIEKNIIKDHNVEGFDSVDSEDFDPGFGCVPVDKPKVNCSPHFPPPVWTEQDQWNYEHEMRTDEQKNEMNYRHLQKFGI